MRKVKFAVLAIALLGSLASVAIEKNASKQTELTIFTMQSGDPPPECQPHVKCPPAPKKQTPRK